MIKDVNMLNIDLTQIISNNMQIFPGDPEPLIKESLVHDNDYCHVNTIHMGSHTGTHIDSPFHFIREGKTINDYPADRFLGPGVLIDVSDKKSQEPITTDDIRSQMSIINPGDFIIFRTGWDIFFGDDRYLDHPYLSPELARRLLEMKVSLVGIDALNVDPTHQEVYPVHDILLGNDILIVENICNLQAISQVRGYYSFLPLKLENSDGSPVRAVFLFALSQ